MKKIVLTCGTFDILHYGHLDVFKQAKSYGDYLIIGLARDENINNYKKEPPFHTEKQRKEFLENIKIIDEVRLGGISDPYKLIDDVRPDVIALGYDQKLFVDKLADKITELDYECQIVRLSPYNEERLKSHNMKKYLDLLDFCEPV